MLWPFRKKEPLHWSRPPLRWVKSQIWDPRDHTQPHARTRAPQLMGGDGVNLQG